MSRSGAKSLGVLTQMPSIVPQTDCSGGSGRHGIGLRLLLE
jgi:hypothetical protein